MTDWMREKIRRRNGEEDELSSKTVTLIAFAYKVELRGRTARVKMNETLCITDTSPATSNNGIFHDLNYFRFFHKLPKS